jgi:hypothetical protein
VEGSATRHNPRRDRGLHRPRYLLFNDTEVRKPRHARERILPNSASEAGIALLLNAKRREISVLSGSSAYGVGAIEEVEIPAWPKEWPAGGLRARYPRAAARHHPPPHGPCDSSDVRSREQPRRFGGRSVKSRSQGCARVRTGPCMFSRYLVHGGAQLRYSEVHIANRNTGIKRKKAKLPFFANWICLYS